MFKDDYPQNSWLWSWLLKFQYLWPFAIELQNMGQKLSSIFLRTKNLCAISEWKWVCRSIICSWPSSLHGDEWGTINCTSSRKSYRCSFPRGRSRVGRISLKIFMLRHKKVKYIQNGRRIESPCNRRWVTSKMFVIIFMNFLPRQNTFLHVYHHIFMFWR